ncbi:MAG TPA: hypothetical protein VFE62_06495 [Gemmataceae bacterium]|nr:hypothetical protein [Gemmataceae bacterium]
MKTHRIRVISRALVVAAIACVLLTSQGTAQDSKPKFDVKIRDEKAVVNAMDDTGAIDPTQRINFNGQNFAGQGFYLNIRTMNNQTLHLSHFPMFKIDERILQPGQGGRFEAKKGDLGKTPGGRKRVGYASSWIIDDIHITQTAELHPTKAKPGQKRLMNTVLISYTIENKSGRAHSVGARMCMDTYVISNDGCLFAAPTHPKKILDGIVLKDKTLPPYVQMLQIPNLDNPGYVSHLTINIGGKYENMNKVVLSSLRAGFGGWDMNAIQAMGDSAISGFWATKEIKPGGKRELAYAYGEGVAVPLGSEGRFNIALGGSFEPGKLCTISAVVADPARGQSLTLELPKGMQRVDGKEIEPVAALAEDQEFSSVLWKARVLEPGEHTIRIRSSNGMTLSKIVTVTATK